MKKLNEGLDVLLECCKCNNTLAFIIPIFNTVETVNTSIWNNIISNKWVACGEEDELFCRDCYNKTLK